MEETFRYVFKNDNIKIPNYLHISNQEGKDDPHNLNDSLIAKQNSKDHQNWSLSTTCDHILNDMASLLKERYITQKNE